MSQIGAFTREPSGFVGRIHTLTLDREVTVVPAEPSDTENAPDYRLHHGNDDGPEIGAILEAEGGPQAGAFLQITGVVAGDLSIPDRPYTFGGLQAAQAGGDRKALADRGRPLLHLHLTDRAAGIGQLLAAFA